MYKVFEQRVIPIVLLGLFSSEVGFAVEECDRSEGKYRYTHVSTVSYRDEYSVLRDGLHYHVTSSDAHNHSDRVGVQEKCVRGYQYK